VSVRFGVVKPEKKRSRESSVPFPQEQRALAPPIEI
jgi:hypothetical protein